MKQFVAVFKHNNQAYYALFSFEVHSLGVTANAEYVKTWPQHELLSHDEGSDVLDATYEDFMGHMWSHIERELQNEH